MRILFGAPHFTCFRNYESVLRVLAERGHHVHVFADAPEALIRRERPDVVALASVTNPGAL